MKNMIAAALLPYPGLTLLGFRDVTTWPRPPCPPTPKPCQPNAEHPGCPSVSVHTLNMSPDLQQCTCSMQVWFLALTMPATCTHVTLTPIPSNTTASSTFSYCSVPQPGPRNPPTATEALSCLPMTVVLKCRADPLSTPNNNP